MEPTPNILESDEPTIFSCIALYPDGNIEHSNETDNERQIHQSKSQIYSNYFLPFEKQLKGNT
jgi:hypothetical protein